MPYTEYENVDEMWSNIETTIGDGAKEVIGPSQVQNRLPWFEDCSQATIRKNQAYTLMLQEKKRIHRCKKRNWGK